jgi:ParB-like chromosome segregation protein Spo0J
VIQIDQEFKELIPALTKEEYEQLEANILAEGVRDSLLVWNGVLIDGHNRYEIATKHGIPFDVQEKEFADRAEAERWIILNQFGRRNLSKYDRSELALKLKPIVAAKAKERQEEGINQYSLCQKSDKPDTIRAGDPRREGRPSFTGSMPAPFLLKVMQIISSRNIETNRKIKILTFLDV